MAFLINLVLNLILYGCVLYLVYLAVMQVPWAAQFAWVIRAVGYLLLALLILSLIGGVDSFPHLSLVK